MANELTITSSMSFQKEKAFASMGKGGVRVTVTGTKYVEIVQAIGTSEEALLLGDIASPGYMMVENLDATNFVEIRPGSGAADMIKIPPLSFAGPFMLATSTPYAIADTAECKIRYLLIEA
jgi:hypothetical protein